MSTDNQDAIINTEVDSSEFTLIDLLQVMAENLRLLIIGPIIAGILVFTAVSFMPKTYSSLVILKADEQTAAIVKTAAVLDPVVLSLGVNPEIDADIARKKLSDSIQSWFSSKDKLLTITSKSYSPEAAQKINNLILEQIYLQSVPKTSEKTRLEQLLAQAKELEASSKIIQQILAEKLQKSSPDGIANLAQAYGEVSRVVQQSQEQQSTLNQSLKGLDSSAIVQDATLPSKNIEIKVALITITAIKLTLLFLLIFVALKNKIKIISQQQKSAYKLEKLKVSLLRQLFL